MRSKFYTQPVMMEVKLKERYCLVSDDDGHWAVIPAYRIDEFYDWLDTVGEEEPDWIDWVGGAPSLVTFENYEIK